MKVTSPVCGSIFTPSGVLSGSSWNGLSAASGTSLVSTGLPSLSVKVGVAVAALPGVAGVSGYAGSNDSALVAGFSPTVKTVSTVSVVPSA